MSMWDDAKARAEAKAEARRAIQNVPHLDAPIDASDLHRLVTENRALREDCARLSLVRTNLETQLIEMACLRSQSELARGAALDRLWEADGSVMRVHCSTCSHEWLVTIVRVSWWTRVRRWFATHFFIPPGQRPPGDP